MTSYLSGAKYSVLLISDAVVIVVRPLFIFNIKTRTRGTHEKTFNLP